MLLSVVAGALSRSMATFGNNRFCTMMVRCRSRRRRSRAIHHCWHVWRRGNFNPFVVTACAFSM